MIRLLGNRKLLCDGPSRRDLLHVGGLSALGVALHQVLPGPETQASESARRGSFGRAPSIFLARLRSRRA
jgi:hypothetical protein